jgi:hypothetical protein
MRLISTVCLGLALVAGIPDIHAQGNGKGKGHKNDGAQPDDRHESTSSVQFSTNDRRVIQEWFAQPSNLKGLPSGLAKKEQLPPGLQKQLVRNGQLPPGLQKRIQPLPPALEQRLTPVPEGTRRFVLNGSVVLLNQHTNLILDIFAAF